jgi:hypothetical protein
MNWAGFSLWPTETAGFGLKFCQTWQIAGKIGEIRSRRETTFGPEHRFRNKTGVVGAIPIDVVVRPKVPKALMLRAMFLPGKVTSEQQAFYVDLFQKVTQTPQYMDYIEKQALKPIFLTSRTCCNSSKRMTRSILRW